MISEFGDFQTPPLLAGQVCELLRRRGVRPASILEPTCGEGNFLVAALEHFPRVQHAVGAEINRRYIAGLESRLQGLRTSALAEVIHVDFFSADWPAILKTLAEPILVVGNPPWVTNAGLGAIQSCNLPPKSNFQGHSGFDAITGKSNFDISEWMLIRLLELLDGRQAWLAMLCKFTVARKVLLHAWKNKMSVSQADVYAFDAMHHFGVSVEACLLHCAIGHGASSTECYVHQGLHADTAEGGFGLRDNQIVANLSGYEGCRHLLASDELFKWRSGIKHDCSRVMEFRRQGRLFRNGLGELVELEDDYVYPMLKSSDLANGLSSKPERWMLVTQRSIGEPTTAIRHLAPRTWKYLEAHSRLLDARASSIYKRRPRFSVFGVGEYSFSPWKVAISGLYKKLVFNTIGQSGEKSIVLDDTCYFLPCRTEAEAEYFTSILNSETARTFYNSLVFWDAKRPITTELLRKLDLSALSRELGSEGILNTFLAQPDSYANNHPSSTLALFG